MSHMEKTGRIIRRPALVIFLTLVLAPLPVFADNFLVVFENGQEITVDLVGYQADRVILHQGQRTWSVDKSTVIKVERLKPGSKPGIDSSRPPAEQARVVRHKLNGQDFTTFEPGYVSTLGRATEEEETAWLKDIILQNRGDPCDPSSRSKGHAVGWAGAPTLSVFGASEERLAAAVAAVEEINRVFAGTTFMIKQVEDNHEPADIVLKFVPRSDFPAGGNAIRDMDGRCLVLGGGLLDPLIRKVSIWVAADVQVDTGPGFSNPTARKAAEKILRQKHFTEIILHELIHALGLSHSAVFEDSVMYCRTVGAAAKRHGRTFLSPRDKKALLFFFEQVNPGDGENDLAEAIRLYWLDRL